MDVDTNPTQSVDDADPGGRAIRVTEPGTELSIRLFGIPEVTSGSHALANPPPIVFQLLAYLLLHQQSHRSAVCTALWPETSERQGRRSLNTAVWRLRRYFEPLARGPGERIVVANGELVCIEPCWLGRSDVFRFSRALAATRASVDPSPDNLAELEAAVDLYRGDLLEGCYDEWLIADRERYRQDLFSGLQRLADWYHGQGDTERAIHFGRRIVELDPLRESVHRALMQLHLERGDRTEALRQFEECRQALADELDTTPMPETAMLATGMRQSLDVGASFEELSSALVADVGEGARPTVAEVVAQLRHARDRADALSRSLTEAMTAVERLAGGDQR